MVSDQGFYVCLQIILLKLNKNEKYHLTTLKTEIDWSKLYDGEIPFGVNGLLLSLVMLSHSSTILEINNIKP